MPRLKIQRPCKRCPNGYRNWNLGEDIASTLSEYTARLGLTPRDMTYDIDLLASEINLKRLANNPADIDAADARHILQTAINNR